MDSVSGRIEVQHRLSLESIALAAKIIDPVFRQTPQFTSAELSNNLGCELTIKIETINPIGCFKGRGASFFVQSMSAHRTDSPIVSASAGNFGQALAYACRAHGLSVTIFAAQNANSLKVDRMRRLGATVRQEGEDFDAAKTAARRWAAESGASMVEDGKQKEIAEGAGSIGVELLTLDQYFDAIILPLGNGALLTGVGRWVKHHSPQTQIIGVCSERAPAMYKSWRTGSMVETNQAQTIADGIAVRIPVPEAVQDMQGTVDQVVLVSEESLYAAMKLIFAGERLIVEPAGAAGVAALIEHPDLRRFSRIATVLCGSNMTPQQIRPYLLP